MAGKRGRPPKADQVATKLANALDFVGVATRPVPGQSFTQHVQLFDGWATAFDGVLSAGCKLDEEFEIAPNLDLLKRALSKAKGTVAFTARENDTLLVSAGKFKASIPGLPIADMPDIEPDANIHAIDDRIKDGFKMLNPLIRDGSEHVVSASLLLQANTMVATDRHIIIEFWHGIDLPPSLVVPKPFVAAIAAQEKKIVGFGWSQGQSITFHFEDESWIKTQLFQAEWPNYLNIFNAPVEPREIPKDFFDAIETVLPFSENGDVFMDGKFIGSHDDPIEGATVECANCPRGYAFNGKRLMLLKDRADTISEGDGRLFFFKTEPAARGCVTGITGRQHGAGDPAADAPVPPQFQPAPERVEPPETPSAPVGEGFDLAAHNARALANQQSADPYAAQYGGMRPDGTMPGQGPVQDQAPATPAFEPPANTWSDPEPDNEFAIDDGDFVPVDEAFAPPPGGFQPYSPTPAMDELKQSTGGGFKKINTGE